MLNYFNVESDLDKVSNGELNWNTVIKKYMIHFNNCK